MTEYCPMQEMAGDKQLLGLVTTDYYPPNSSLQCEHFFFPLTLSTRSWPVVVPPTSRGGTWGPARGPAGGPGEELQQHRGTVNIQMQNQR